MSVLRCMMHACVRCFPLAMLNQSTRGWPPPQAQLTWSATPYMPLCPSFYLLDQRRGRCLQARRVGSLAGTGCFVLVMLGTFRLRSLVANGCSWGHVQVLTKTCLFDGLNMSNVSRNIMARVSVSEAQLVREGG